jgi:GNAT superfamily N-acetyltransferase
MLTPEINATNITLRRAVPSAADANALSAIALHTFIDTYTHANDPNNMQAHCQQHFGEAQQLAEISHPNNIILFAYVDTLLTGFAFLTQRQKPECVLEDNTICLLRFYVLKEWHGKGIAAALMSEVISAANNAGAQSLWLTMWEHNQRAHAYYLKSGFTRKGSAAFHFGTEVQTDYVFIKSL